MYTMLPPPPANRDMRDFEQVMHGLRLKLFMMAVRTAYVNWMLLV